jgi:hypothetical protein
MPFEKADRATPPVTEDSVPIEANEPDRWSKHGTLVDEGTEAHIGIQYAVAVQPAHES